MGLVPRIKHDVTFRRVRQVAVPVGRQTTTLWGVVCYLRLPCLVTGLTVMLALTVLAYLLNYD